jgi:hypothetical protein
MAREPKLGAVVGKKGVGKSFTTAKMLEQYVRGDIAKGIAGRRVLIFDVNDEYSGVQAISVQNVKAFSAHPIVEIRRIRPLHENGQQMTLNQLADVLMVILQEYRGGLLLIEDINKYISDSLPNDLIGAICTNRHIDLDIIMHFQSIGRLTPKIWQNLNWIRFHKNGDSVEKHEKKLDDKYEICKIAEHMVNQQYFKGNNRYYLYVDLDDEKIYGNYTKAMVTDAIEQFIAENHSKIIAPLIRRNEVFGKDKNFTKESAINQVINNKIAQYTNHAD